MSEVMIGEGRAGGPVLPRAHVLSYIAKAETPTRVRRVSSVGVLIIGILFLLGTGLVSIPVGALNYSEARQLQALAARPGIVRIARGWRLGPPPAHVPSMAYCLVVQGYRDIVRLGVLLLMWVAGVVMILCTRKIREGNGWACRVAAVCLWGPGTVLFVMSVGAGAVALVYGTSVLGYRAYPEELAWGLLLLVTVPGVLLHFDLVRFLMWIARNPIGEKPAMPFLPS